MTEKTKRRIKKALLVVNETKDGSSGLVAEITEFLEREGTSVAVYKLRCEADFNVTREYADMDIAFSLGGDGTVLFSSRLLASHDTPILAINLGDFGFITEVSKDEWKTVYDRYCHGELGISERLMLKVAVERNGEVVAEFEGLNDAVISAAGISKVVRLTLTISGTILGQYRADGVIVSTPTGSTAYSAAAGGPILDPEMEALIINPICPFTLSNRPIVCNANVPVYIEIQRHQRTEVILTTDGQRVFPLEPQDKVCFTRAAKKARIIRSHSRNFYEVLRTKLNWAGGPDA